MLTREMAKIIEQNADTIGYSATDLMQLFNRIDGISSEERNSHIITPGMQRELTSIIGGTYVAVGDPIAIRPEFADFYKTANVYPDQIGIITHIRWPNSENCGQLVVQADFPCGNMHFNASKIIRVFENEF